MNKPYPYPEIVNPGSWDIQDGGENFGYTDLTNRRMVVPLDPSHFSEIIRNHEMAHAWAKCRQRKTFAHPTAVQIAEDLRLKFKAQKRHVVTICNCSSCVQTASETSNQIATVRLAGVSQAEAKYRTLLSLLLQVNINGAIPLPMKIISKVYQLARKRNPYPLAEYLTEILGLVVSAGCKLKEQQDTDTSALPDDWPQPLWTFPPLTEKAFLGSRVTFSDDGVPVAPWRIDTIARMKRHHATTSLLIDTSSSMSINQVQVRSVIRKHPAAVVATYSNGNAALVGAHGYMVTDLTKFVFYGWNTTDLPCLKWLARQPKPRIWVTDGAANKGRSDVNQEQSQAQCFTFAHANAIQIVRRLD